MLVRASSENSYLGIYSLISLVSIVWLIYLYSNMEHTVFIWQQGTLNSAIPIIFMPLVVIFLASGLVAKNPTAMKMEASLGEEVTGILRISRHPVQWGILVWAVTHMISNGDLASLIFFGCFAIVAGLGTLLLDRKRAGSEGDKWTAFVEKTSNVPFLAVLSGRNQFKPGEIGWISIVIGLLLYILMFLFHAIFTGVALYSF
jgi:uncharacterized membrane protein